MQATVYNLEGEQVSTIDLNEDVFGIEPNVAVMHQALVRQLANARLGTAQTKTRGMVSGGGRKPWRQKGTGRARQGSTRAPQWRGGGVVFGPHPRSYVQDMPRKARRLALRSALSSKVQSDELILVDDLQLEEPKTKRMTGIFAALGVSSGALVVLPEPNENVSLSTRNIPTAKAILAQYLNLADLMKYRRLIMPVAAVKVVESWLSPSTEQEKGDEQ